jgi:hypothetical protein
VPTAAPTPNQLPQCSDGIDNDGDGLIDWGINPLVNETIDCLGPDDNSEALI